MIHCQMIIKKKMIGESVVGNAIYDKDSQLDYLKNRLNMFLEVIDSLDPESTELDDIDRLIQMLDDLEFKYEQFKSDGNDEN
jgi:hypothetical protein